MNDNTLVIIHFKTLIFNSFSTNQEVRKIIVQI